MKMVVVRSVVGNIVVSKKSDLYLRFVNVLVLPAFFIKYI